MCRVTTQSAMRRQRSSSIFEKGMDMTEDEERKARERDEIAARVAAFRATQEKFKREREEFCVSTLENARKVERPSLWP